jgi:copper chaperone
MTGGFFMERTVLQVDGMSCEHCVKAITKAVGALQVGGVKVDLKSGAVTVDYDPDEVPLDKIKAAIEDQGYDVAV